MQHPQPEEAPGSAGAPTPNPGTHPAGALPDQPTVHEFLSRLVASSEARSAFEADPRASLDQAGLGDMSATDVLQATSLVLDYAPVEVVEEYGRSLQSSVEKFAASTQHVAINELHPAHPNEQEVTELSMLKTSQAAQDFGKSGDVEPQIAAPSNAKVDVNKEVNVEQHDSQNLLSVHDVLSGNNVANGVGNVAAVGNSAENVTSNVDNSVKSVTNTVDHTVDTSNNLIHDIGGGLPTPNDLIDGLPHDLPVVGDVAGALPAPHDLPVVGDVASSLPAPGDLPVVGNVAGALPAPTDLPVAGDVASALPLDHVL
jgi:hypothetical protein